MFVISIHFVLLGLIVACAADEGKPSVLSEPAQLAEPQAQNPSAPAPTDQAADPSYRMALVILKSDWKNCSNAAEIEHHVKRKLSVSQAEKFDLMNAGAGLAFGAPGWCSKFLDKELAWQLAWLRKHGLLKRIVPLSSGDPIGGDELQQLAVLRRLNGEIPSEQTFEWRLRLMVERTTSDFIGGPYWRLRMDRTLYGLGFPESDEVSQKEDGKRVLDFAGFSFGTHLPSQPLYAYSMNLFSLERDSSIREDLHTHLDEAVFVVIYPSDEPFRKLFRKDAALEEMPADFQSGVANHSMSGLEQTGNPRRAWGATRDQQGIPVSSISPIGDDTAFPIGDITPLAEQIAELRREIKNLETAISAQTARIQKLETPDEALLLPLSKDVERLFDTQQQLQIAEAKRMRMKLQKIEANLRTREKNRSQLVKQLVAELLRQPD